MAVPVRMAVFVPMGVSRLVLMALRMRMRITVLMVMVMVMVMVRRVPTMIVLFHGRILLELLKRPHIRRILGQRSAIQALRRWPWPDYSSRSLKLG